MSVRCRRLRLLLLISAMALKQSQSYLHQYFPNEVLIDVLSFFLAFVYKLCKIATLAVFHYNIQRCVLFVDNFIIAPHNIFVLQLSQNIYFIYQLVNFFFFKFTVVNLFPYHFFICGQVSDQRYLSKSSLAYIFFDHFVFVHISNLNIYSK